MYVRRQKPVVQIGTHKARHILLPVYPIGNLDQIVKRLGY